MFSVAIIVAIVLVFVIFSLLKQKKYLDDYIQSQNELNGSNLEYSAGSSSPAPTLSLDSRDSEGIGMIQGQHSPPYRTYSPMTAIHYDRPLTPLLDENVPISKLKRLSTV